MKNNENVGGAYRRHEGEGDEEHESLKAGLKKAEGMLAQVGSRTQLKILFFFFKQQCRVYQPEDAAVSAFLYSFSPELSKKTSSFMKPFTRQFLYQEVLKLAKLSMCSYPPIACSVYLAGTGEG